MNQYHSKNKYRLPFNGEWFVCTAGDTINVNHHMSSQSQWFGMDFARSINRSLVTPKPNGLEDYFSWNQEILSPISGMVISTVNDVVDLKVGKKNSKYPFGNHIIISAANNEFVILAHLRAQSINVAVNQKIACGQVIGYCGNSGNSDFPHLHMHVQTVSDLNSGQGLIAVFNNISVQMTGHEFKNVNWPLISGMFVEQNSSNDA